MRTPKWALQDGWRGKKKARRGERNGGWYRRFEIVDVAVFGLKEKNPHDVVAVMGL